MKELVVVSGKGGVGKTSIAASLAVLLSRKLKVTAADTDVDAPNLAIVLGADVRRELDVRSSEKAVVDVSKCTGCGKCVEVCKFNSITLAEGKAVVDRLACEGCGACSIVCPTNAISIVQVKTGEVGVADTEYGFKLVSGHLEIGEANSGHVVTAVKWLARRKAEEEGADLLIVDGPPGIGCPVIASLAAASHALVVSEPTPAGAWNLTRIIQVINHFKIPFMLVVNKWNLSPQYTTALEAIAKQGGGELAARIPVDYTIAEAMAMRKPVVAYKPEAESSKAIAKLADIILERLS